VLDAFDVTERVAWLELDLTRLLTVDPKISQWKPTSRFPSTDLDLAFVVPDSVAAEKVDKAIRQAGGGLLTELTLFDVFRGPGIEAGARSLAYRMRLQANDRTLTDAEVAAIRDKAAAVMSKMGARLRA
jgi:phenylalanyl-tRNA synthetase beta chain